MRKMIDFFVQKERLNYFLFVVIIIAGIIGYQKITKEIFPQISMDKVQVIGQYPGANIDNLNKMAVIELEEALTSIEGISEINTVIKPGKFTITGDLTTGKLAEVKDDVETEVKKILINLPSDMDEPVVSMVDRSIQLMNVIVSSKTKNQKEILKKVKSIEERIKRISGVSNVTIFGDADKQMMLKLEENKIIANGFTVAEVTAALSNISYLFPLGKIEERGGKNFYINSWNGKKDEESLKSTLLKISGKKIYLSELVKVEETFEEVVTMSTLNGAGALMLKVDKTEEGDSIKMSNKLKNLTNKLNEENPEYKIEIFNDTSKMIKERIDIVLSNIFLGVILVVLSLFILINKRISFVVGLGIPTAFLLGLLIFMNTGNTINLISLLGVLIAIGVLVDDAIIVSENIQRHLEEGLNKYEATIQGTKEVAGPVFMASITTMFAFLPMMMMSGEMGNFILMIPLAVIILIIASVIESFVFLPLHAKHILDPKDKESDWSKVNNFYKTKLKILIRWKKSSVFAFVILIPLLIGVGLSHSKFQFFPKFDSNNLYVTAKLNVNTEIEETYKILTKIEKEILENKKEWSILNTTGKAGFRLNSRQEVEQGSNLMFITLELEELKPKTVVDKYITPYISFYYDPSKKKRDMESSQVAKELKKQIAKYKTNKLIEEIEVIEDKPGIVKSDIYIAISQTEESIKNKVDIRKVISKIEKELKKVDGIEEIKNNAADGISEIKVKVNQYGEKLGLTERYVSNIIKDNFLGNKKSSYYDYDGMFDIVYENNLKDKRSQLENLLINVPGTKEKVILKDVVEFHEIKEFEKMEKEKGVEIKAVSASVNVKKLTATEAVEKVMPKLKQIAEDNQVLIELKGEAEKKEDLKNDMTKAFSIALVLILVSLLLMFNSFKTAAIILSVIPFSFLGVLVGHFIMDMNLTMPSIIGALGLAGVVINDGIVMLTFLEKAKSGEDLLKRAVMRLRPIALTSITTFIGLGTLMFFATGQAVIMQPLAISLGFGLLWGTILNLYYVPVLYAIVKKIEIK